MRDVLIALLLGATAAGQVLIVRSQLRAARAQRRMRAALDRLETSLNDRRQA